MKDPNERPNIDLIADGISDPRNVPALLALMESREAEGLAVNLGSQEEISILGLAKLVIDRSGSSSKIQLIPYQDVYVGGFEDMPRRVPDINRARKLIGFEPVTMLPEIVDSIIDDVRRRH